MTFSDVIDIAITVIVSTYLLYQMYKERHQ